MGYRELKNIADDKMKRVKRIFLYVGVFLLVALLILSAFYPPASWKYYFSLPKVGKWKQKELRVHFMDVGQGDCIVIQLPDGKTMLVDGGGGGARTEKTVLRYLNALEIDVIDYLLITHTDDDHCGAIAEVVKMKKVLNAYLPASYDITSGKYAEAYAALAKSECNLLETNSTVNLSQEKETPYTLSFLYPYSEGITEEDNEGSAVFWLDYMGISFLFTGDAPVEVEEDLVRDDTFGLLGDDVELSSTEILKVGHHGSVYSSSMALLDRLNLETAIISCGKNNAHGHPADVVLGMLEVVGAEVYRTDQNGHIIVTVSAGGEYAVKTVKR